MEEHPLSLINCCFCDKDLSPSSQEGDNRITKYKCPGCERFYCNSGCFVGHKDKLQCLGIRNKTPYVHLSKFDQKQFLDDYFFLEEVNQKLESIQHSIPKLKPNKDSNTKRRKNRRRGKGKPTPAGCSDKQAVSTDSTQQP